MCFIGRINLTLFKKLSGNGFRVGSSLFFAFLFTCALFTSPVRKVLQQTIPLTVKFFTPLTPLTHETQITFLLPVSANNTSNTSLLFKCIRHKYVSMQKQSNQWVSKMFTGGFKNLIPPVDLDKFNSLSAMI